MTGIVVYSPCGLRHTYSEDELTTPPRARHLWLTFTESMGEFRLGSKLDHATE